VSDAPVGRTKHGELTLDQIAGLQPGLGRIMRELSERYWTMYYSAKGGNWELAAYCLRGMRSLQRMGETTRPKMAGALRSFADGYLDPLDEAIRARDWNRFEAAYTAATDEANRVHRSLGYGYIEWRLPPRPPEHLTLAPVDAPAQAPAQAIEEQKT
jgi:hypothetical protein